MEFHCNLEDLEAVGLTFTEYLVLFGIYNMVVYRNIDINEKVYDSLVKKDYIYKEDKDWKLSDKGFDFFAPKDLLFEKFIETFPTRVVDPISGAVRVLSPAGSNTIAGNKFRKKWDSLTKGNAQLQEHIIKCLEAEIRIRKNAGNLQFMRNIETWLNNGTWEDYEYAIDKSSGNTDQPSTRNIRL